MRASPLSVSRSPPALLPPELTQSTHARSKYKFMEQSSLQRRAGLEEKVPELERTIEMVDLLIRKKVRSALLLLGRLHSDRMP